jgi:hypothetical protein
MLWFWFSTRKQKIVKPSVRIHKVTIYYNKPLNKIFIPWHNSSKVKSKDESSLPQKEIHLYVLKKKLKKENQQQIKNV